MQTICDATTAIATDIRSRSRRQRAIHGAWFTQESGTREHLSPSSGLEDLGRDAT
jgi:hypothetical protein